MSKNGNISDKIECIIIILGEMVQQLIYKQNPWISTSPDGY